MYISTFDLLSLLPHNVYTGVWITIVWIVIQVRSEATRGAVSRMHYCIPEWHVTHYWLLIIGLLFLPPGCTLLVWPAGPKIAYVFCTCLFVCWFFCWCIPIYHVCNNYITYIVAMQLYFSQLWTAASSTGVANVSSLAQLRVQDINKQRQNRHDNARLTESGNIRSKQRLQSC